jgi:glycosyltransferase involved in cell wall biosynthesis
MDDRRRPIAVLHLLPRLEQGGVESYVVDCAVGMVSDPSFRIHVASEGGSLADALKRHGVMHHTIPLAQKNPWSMVESARRIATLVKQHAIDIMHVHSRGPAWSALMARLWTQKKCRLISTFHGVYGGFSNPLKRFYNSAMVRGNMVLGVSGFIHHHIQTYYNVDDTKVKALHEGIDTHFFSPHPKDISSQQQEKNRILHDVLKSNAALSMEEASLKKILLIVGRLTPIKGHALLFEAVSMMPKHERPIIVSIGAVQKNHPTLLNDLHQMARARHIDWVHYPEFLDLKHGYGLCDGVVVPSVKPESFGRVAAEALAMGKVVIGANHGGVKELCAAQPKDLLHQPKDVKDLHRALCCALSLHASDRHSIGIANRQYMVHHYDVHHMVDQLKYIYETGV